MKMYKIASTLYLEAVVVPLIRGLFVCLGVDRRDSIVMCCEAHKRSSISCFHIWKINWRSPLDEWLHFSFSEIYPSIKWSCAYCHIYSRIRRGAKKYKKHRHRRNIKSHLLFSVAFITITIQVHSTR